MLILCKLFIAHFILSSFYAAKVEKDIFNEEKLERKSFRIISVYKE